jgi:hypothetical protein
VVYAIFADGTITTLLADRSKHPAYPACRPS